MAQEITEITAENLAKLDAKFIDEAVLKRFIRMRTPTNKDITKAKTQAEKNVNILPPEYTKIRDALIRLVEQQNIHDPKNYGRNKTLTQRFREVIKRVDPSFNPMVHSVSRDVYIKMMQRDIIGGRAADLTPDDLKLVLSGNVDKDGFYIRRVPREILTYDVIQSISPKQWAILLASHPKNVEDSVSSPDLSLADKRMAVAAKKRAVDADAPARQILKERLAQYKRDHAEKIKNPNDAVNIAYDMVYYLEQIQGYTEQIDRYVHNSKNSKNEKHLAHNALENTIFDYLTDTSEHRVQRPVETGLPLFGRGTEKDRRAELNKNIEKLNRVLLDIRDKLRRAPLALELTQRYRGNILNPESLASALAEYQELHKIANDRRKEFRQKYDDHAFDTLALGLRRQQADVDTLARATDELQKRTNKLRELAKKRMALDNNEKLEPITPDMSPEDKNAARKRNRIRQPNKLAAKEKQQDRSLEMAKALASARNGRS